MIVASWGTDHDLRLRNCQGWWGPRSIPNSSLYRPGLIVNLIERKGKRSLIFEDRSMNSIGSFEKTHAARGLWPVWVCLLAPQQLVLQIWRGWREQITKRLKGPWHFLKPHSQLRHNLGHKKQSNETWKIYIGRVRTLLLLCFECMMMQIQLTKLTSVTLEHASDILESA